MRSTSIWLQSRILVASIELANREGMRRISIGRNEVLEIVERQAIPQRASGDPQPSCDSRNIAAAIGQCGLQYLALCFAARGRHRAGVG